MSPINDSRFFLPWTTLLPALEPSRNYPRYPTITRGHTNNVLSRDLLPCSPRIIVLRKYVFSVRLLFSTITHPSIASPSCPPPYPAPSFQQSHLPSPDRHVLVTQGKEVNLWTVKRGSVSTKTHSRHFLVRQSRSSFRMLINLSLPRTATHTPGTYHRLTNVRPTEESVSDRGEDPRPERNDRGKTTEGRV